LKATITTDGVWRIRRAERSPVVEVFQIEEAGHGAILSDEFINWRIKLSLGAEKPVPGDSNVPSESEEI
jgi:RAT1-interacting protein